ncbi:MAG TPA: M56 family metallopeptidase [Terriglobales bacterium]|nr:M56 family metallopeptidase [Terriglobales bacterium]
MSPLQSLAQLTSIQIANCFVVGIAVAALAGAGCTLARRQRSAMRFVIWFAGLIAIASLFFFSRPIGHSAATHIGSAQISLRPEWAIYIFSAWVFFAALGLARVARGLWRVRLLKNSSAPVDGLDSFSDESVQGSRKFSICVSEEVRVPAALGFFRPVVVLPAWAVRELSREELHTIVLHEAAHLQRWDDWTNLLQKVLRAVLFFHPAVWWIDSRLSIEREMSCDDMVLARSRSARQYAACLVSLAEKTRAHRSLALVQAAVSHLKHTAQRISKILDGHERTNKPLLKPAVAAAAVFGAVSFVAVQRTPQLVGFQDPASVRTASAKRFDYVANANGPLAKAVNASLHAPRASAVTSLKARVPAAGKQPVEKVQHRANRAPAPQVEEARSINERAPMVVNAAMSDTGVPSFVYLVTQTEQYDAFGNVTFMTSIWRIRVMKPAPLRASSPVPPHQT